MQSIRDLLSELDIQLDENGNVSRDDIILLITRALYNINALFEKINRANDLSTYLTFKMSKEYLYKASWSETEVYPTQSIQVRNLYYDHIKGNVALSEKQKFELKDEQRRSVRKTARILNGDMFK